MTRFGPALAILLAVAGCGAITYAPDPSASWPNGGGRPAACRLVVHTAPAEVETVPDCARIPEASVGFSRMGGGRGYFWIGYTVADVGQQELNDVGSGDGFSFGTGFKLSEAGRTFVEFAWERTLKHPMNPNIVVSGVGDSVAERGVHERTLLGLRTATAARARETTQPRPYVSYGVGYNHVSVVYDAGGGATDTFYVNALGYYLGLGCEFPSEGRGSFSFDMKFHTWEDDHVPAGAEEGMYGSIAYSLLWINRF